MRNKFFKVLTLFLACASLQLHALPDDEDKPIHITADSASINDATGITTYKGNVVIKQGSLLIEADRVDMHRKDGDVQKLISQGSPAYFRQQPKVDEPFTDAWGLNMVYQVDDKILTITEEAKVIQDKDSFTGEKIVYDLDKSIVDAFGSKADEPNGRVNMVIQPKKKSTEKQ